MREALGVPYRRLMELADYLSPDEAQAPDARARMEDSRPMTAEAPAAAPTNAELARLLEAVGVELAEIRAGQRRLVQMLEQVGVPPQPSS